jgi:drug/metabolite transporter (DMT)-like permease
MPVPRCLPGDSSAASSCLPGRTLAPVIAILGGLGAAVLWATATLCSSRSSRMIGSRVVLAWVMIVGVVVGLPVAIVSPGPATLEPSTLALLGLAGICYVVGLQLTYAALRVGKVSIVAPIVATEGAVAALIAVALGDRIGPLAALMLGVIAAGVVLSTLEPGKTDVPAGDFDLVADAIDEPTTQTAGARPAPVDARRTALLSVGAALVFGVGLVAAGKSAALVPVAWVALTARVVGILAVVVPLLLQRRLRVTRAALPLVVVAGVGEVIGSMLSAWGSRDSIAITAVMGSQFAAFASVAAFFLFRERLGRVQVIGVVLIVGGVTVLAAATA